MQSLQLLLNNIRLEQTGGQPDWHCTPPKCSANVAEYMIHSVLSSDCIQVPELVWPTWTGTKWNTVIFDYEALTTWHISGIALHGPFSEHLLSNIQRSDFDSILSLQSVFSWNMHRPRWLLTDENNHHSCSSWFVLLHRCIMLEKRD